jgi:hypothetical protein
VDGNSGEVRMTPGAKVVGASFIILLVIACRAGFWV